MTLFGYFLDMHILTLLRLQVWLYVQFIYTSKLFSILLQLLYEEMKKSNDDLR